MAVNSLFKKLKLNFDDLKLMIGDLNEIQTLKHDYFLVQRDLQDIEIRSPSLEYRLKRKFDQDCEQ